MAQKELDIKEEAIEVDLDEVLINNGAFMNHGVFMNNDDNNDDDDNDDDYESPKATKKRRGRKGKQP